MAVTTHTLTGDFNDLIGGDIDPRLLRARVITNVPNGQAIVDTTTGDVYLGEHPIDVAADGTFTVAGLPATNDPNLNITGSTLRYMVVVEHRLRDTPGMGRWDSGWFELTADVHLGQVVGTDYIDPTFASQVQTFVTAEADRATAAADQAAAPTAEQMAVVDADPASTFRTQQDARLNAAYADRELVDTGRLSEPALSATFAHARLARPGAAAVFLGDSTTIGSAQESTFNYGPAWPSFACMYSQQRIRYLYNAGKAGDGTTQMLARIQTDVIDRDPSVCFVSGGVNDIGSGIAFSTFQANIEDIVAALRQAGIGIVLCTIPPNNDSARHQKISLWNAWLKRYASTQGIALVDFHELLADPANGNYLAAYFGDATHPNNAGYAAMGQLVADKIAPLVPAYRPTLANTNTDPNNLLANGLFMTDSNADGRADSWNEYTGAGSGRTYALVTDAQVKGQMQRLACAGSTSIFIITQTIAGTQFAVGDRLMIAGVLSSTGVSAEVKVTFSGSSVNGKPVGNLAPPFTRAVFYQEFIVPAGATAAQVLLQAGAGTGNVDVGQLTVYNLTALGLA